MTTLASTNPKIIVQSIAETYRYLQLSLMENLKLDKEDLDELGKEENLFQIGLDSISMADLGRRWKKDLGIVVKNADFLREPTLQRWANLLFAKIQEQNPATRASDNMDAWYISDKSARFKKFKLGAIQNAYLAGRNAELPWGGISCYGYFERDTVDLNFDALQLALNDLIQRHEMLRVQVSLDGFQRIMPTVAYEIRRYSLKDSLNVQVKLADIRAQMEHQILPLGQPLFDLRVTEMPANSWRIHFGMDFMGSDALSLRIFWRDLSIFYAQRIGTLSRNNGLPEIKASYRDYIFYLEKRKKSSLYEIDKCYWMDRLSSFPPAPQLPLKQQTSAFNHAPAEFSHFEKCLDNKSWQKFCKGAAAQKLTPTAALLAIFAEVIAAWSTTHHFGLLLTVFDRAPVHPDIDKVIGDFTHLSLLRVNRKNQRVTENAHALQQQMQEDLEHKTFSALALVKALNQTSDAAEYFYPVVFTSVLGLSMEEHDLGDINLFGKVGYSSSQTPQVWLDAQVLTKNGNTVLAWDALESIFPAGVVLAMFDRFTELVDTAIEDAVFWESTLTDLRPKQQFEWHSHVNKTAYPFPMKLLHEPIFEQAKQHPNKVAIVFNGHGYSYQQLTESANRLSSLLHRKGIPGAARIVVHLQNSFEAVAVILGILQYGAAYIPIAYNNPKFRSVEMIRQADAHAMITDQDFTDLVSERIDFMTLTLRDIALENQEPINFPTRNIGPEAIAYMIFTSGSTGKPKGVVISHKAASNTILDVNRRFQVTENEVGLMLSALSFDLSVYDIFGVLGRAGKLVIANEQERIDPIAWKSLITQHKVTLWNSVPALFTAFLDAFSEHNFSSLTKIFLSGDWIPLSTFDRMQPLLPQAELIGMGGATEASIWSNYQLVTARNDDWTSIPYGLPLSNQQYYILDEARRPCPTAVKGKLHIAGSGLAQGYWGQKESTERAFFWHPRLQKRLYDTGDYGRYMEDGRIEFLGRADEQLKINGYRIEAAEIQMAIQRCYPDLTAVILPLGAKTEPKKLVAFVKTKPETFCAEDLKRLLADYLPPYFIPDYFIPMLNYPLGSNGKIDYHKLKDVATAYRDFPVDQSCNKPILTAKPPIGMHPVLLVVRHVLAQPDITIDTAFSRLGISSMDMIRLANQLEHQFLARPTVAEMVKLDSVAGLIAYYNKKDIHFERLEVVDTVPVKPQFLLYSAELMAYLDGLPNADKISLSPYLSKQNRMLHAVTTENRNFALAATDKPDVYSSWRKKYQSFAPRILSLKDFEGFINLCSAQQTDQNFRFGYASVDEIYPVQVYVSVFNNRVEGLPAGYYYFDPYIRELQPIFVESNNLATAPYLPQGAPEHVAFAIHLLADMASLFPYYQRDSLVMCMLEAGRIAQLLESDGMHYNIGSIGGNAVDFEAFRPYYNLSLAHYHLHTLMAGAIDFDAEKKALLALQQSLGWQAYIPTLTALLAACKQQQVQLWLDGDKLKFRSPQGGLNGDLLKQLKTHKPLLVDYLQSDTYKSTPQQERFPLTPIQKAYLWGRDSSYTLGNVGSHYYCELLWPFLAVDKLEDAINQVIAIHDGLRTVIYADGTQSVRHENCTYTLHITDLQPEQVRKERAHFQYPIGQWPMFHFEVSRAHTERCVLHLSIDLLVLDAWSANLLLREIVKAYSGQQLLTPSYTVRQYLIDELSWHAKFPQFLQKAEEYWASKLSHIPPAPALPYSKELTAIKQPRFERYGFTLTSETLELLRAKARNYRMDATAVFACLFSKLLSYWSAGKAVSLNMTLFNRLSLHAQVDQVLGDFTNLALISYFPKQHGTFLQEAIAMQEQLWMAIEHRAKDGLELLRSLNKRNPRQAVMPVVFTSLLNNNGSQGTGSALPDGVRELYAVSQTPQVVLDHQIYRQGDCYQLNWDVVEEAFDLKQLRDMLKRYEAWIQQLVAADDWDIQLDSASHT